MSLSLSLNCSDTSRLRSFLTQLLQQLNQVNSTSSTAEENVDSDDAYLYILLIMIFYGCLAGGLILAYTRSRRKDSKNDPYHLYIEREWGRSAKNVPSLDDQYERGSIESQQLL